MVPLPVTAVAYCLGITNIDPIKYDLLFERFLNPDRVSMPDIDIDFEDDGRGRVLDYVIEKYWGKTKWHRSSPMVLWPLSPPYAIQLVYWTCL